MYDEIRAYIKAQIESKTGLNASFIDAKNGASHPYITFDISEGYSNMIGKHIYNLTIDIWDIKTPKNCISAVKSLDKAWKQAKATLDHAVISIYHGASSGFVADEDKEQVHYVRSYEVMAFERGE